MSCMLRASGVSFDVDAFCGATSLPVAARHRLGEPRRAGSTYSRSSVSVDVSDADFSDLPRQVADAIAFLERHAEEVRRLVAFPGVESAELDFGVAWRDVAAQFDSLPPPLVSLAGALGLGLTISHYAMCDPE